MELREATLKQLLWKVIVKLNKLTVRAPVKERCQSRKKTLEAALDTYEYCDER
jgi:hypothetical protein